MDNAVFVDLMVELAGLEEELSELRGLREARGRRLREITLRREVAEESADQADQASRAAEAGYRGSSGALRDAEALLARKRDQLIGVTDRRQFKALQVEIGGLERRLDDLETAALEFLEEPSAGTAPLSVAATEDRSAEIKQIEAAQEKAALAEEEITGEIDRLVAMVPASHGGHLKRLRGQYSRSVVRVADRACGGCGGQLPQQQALDAAGGKAAVRCPSCARYVVRQSYK